MPENVNSLSNSMTKRPIREIGWRRDEAPNKWGGEEK